MRLFFYVLVLLTMNSPNNGPSWVVSSRSQSETSQRTEVQVTGGGEATFRKGTGIMRTKFRHDSSIKHLKKFTGLYTGPYFNPVGNPGNVTVQLGETALLPCKVKQLGQTLVSWIRKKDSHILTVDQTTFIADDRFFILRDSTDNEKWTLHIRYIHPSDAGLYECQISTEPKMSHFVQLNVIQSQVSIEGNSDVHANDGSRVAFRCHIEKTLQKPDFVFWYHNHHRLMVDQSSEEALMTSEVKDDSDTRPSSFPSSNGVSSTIEARRLNMTFESISSHHHVATLELANVKKSQSGNYSCKPSNTRAVSVRLHVIDGETRAAMSNAQGCVSSRMFIRAHWASLGEYLHLIPFLPPLAQVVLVGWHRELIQ